MASTRAKCPVCGTNLRAENLAHHLRDVHPGKADASAMRQAERAAHRGTSEERTRRVKKGLPFWLLPFTVILVILVVLGAVIYVLLPPAETDPTKMCVNHTTIGRHRHVTLSIVILGTAVLIPEGVGIEGDCMRPLHTHAADNVIHVEGPPNQDFVLGDFFDIWRKPFNATCVMTYCADANHELVMTVDSVPSTAFGDLVLENNMNVVIEYRQR